MPVEESGNIILMVAALAHAEHSPAYAERYWPLLTKWVEFLLARDSIPKITLHRRFRRALGAQHESLHQGD